MQSIIYMRMSENNYDQIKNRRENFAVQIRRKNREEIMNKRRNNQVILGTAQESFEEPKLNKIVDQRFRKQIQEFVNAEYDESMFDHLSHFINSLIPVQQLKGVIGMRKLLAKNVDPPIKRFIDKGLTNKCIWLARQKQYPQTKLEAAWILTNVAAGQSSFCEKLVERGGIQLFVTLLQQNQQGIIEQAIWGIGNLAADKIKYRDEILKKGGLAALIEIMQKSNDMTIIRNGSWAITNLCRGVPIPDFKYIKEACPLLCKVIKTGTLQASNNKEILSDVIWAIAHMTEGSKARVQKVNKAQILPQIFKFAEDPYSQIFTPALKILGNFSNGNENHTDQLIKHGIFKLSMKFLEHPKKTMRKQVCWTLSNIAAGVQRQVQQFLQQIQLLDKIAVLFYQDLVQVKREICWIYANMGLLGNRVKVTELYLHYDIIRIFVNLLTEEDAQTLQNVLETLYKILYVGSKVQKNGVNILLKKFCEYGGAINLQNLQMHQNKTVYQQTHRILTKFFQLQTQTI